jgi:GDP-L-fucose synthase
MKKSSIIFVAGGTGLVGSAIIRSLLARGYENILSSYHNRRPDISDERVKWVKMDLMDMDEVSSFMKEYSPEYIFLAAAKVGGIVANNRYRADFIYENLSIQNSVIHNSYLNGVKKLLFLGSTCIYPRESPQPMKEEYLLTSPLEYTNEPYAIAKIAGIKMCESYNLQYGTNFISVMPTNLYGPNDNFDLEKSHVLPALIRKMHLGKALDGDDWESVRKDLDRSPIEGIDGSSQREEIVKILEKYGISHKDGSTVIDIWGSGRPKREFLWSEDMAEACIFLMENIDFDDIVSASSATGDMQDRPKEIRNTHINIGTGEDISISDLAHLIKEIVGFGGELHFDREKPDGTMKKLTDPSKLHSLGWRHRIDLSVGIEKLYEWYIRSQRG